MAVLPINELKSKIDANIYQNSNQEITGGKLNTILNDVVDSLDADISAVDAGLTELEQDIGELPSYNIIGYSLPIVKTYTGVIELAGIKVGKAKEGQVRIQGEHNFAYLWYIMGRLKDGNATIISQGSYQWGNFDQTFNLADYLSEVDESLYDYFYIQLNSGSANSESHFALNSVTASFSIAVDIVNNNIADIDVLKEATKQPIWHNNEYYNFFTKLGSSGEGGITTSSFLKATMSGIVNKIRLYINQIGRVDIVVGKIDDVVKDFRTYSFHFDSIGVHEVVCEMPIEKGEYVGIGYAENGNLPFDTNAFGTTSRFIQANEVDGIVTDVAGYVCMQYSILPTTLSGNAYQSAISIGEEYGRHIAGTPYVQPNNEINIPSDRWYTYRNDDTIYNGIIRRIKLHPVADCEVTFGLGTIDQRGWAIIDSEFTLSFEANEGWKDCNILINKGQRLFIKGDIAMYGTTNMNAYNQGNGLITESADNIHLINSYVASFGYEIEGIKYGLSSDTNSEVTELKEHLAVIEDKVNNISLNTLYFTSGSKVFRLSVDDNGNLTTIEVQGKKISIFGNSIEIHGYSDYWWSDDRGMASSTRDKDYPHRLVNMLTNQYETPTSVSVYNIAEWERMMDSWSMDRLDAYLENPDLVIVRVGENITYDNTYENRVSELISYIRSKTSAPIIYGGVFWKNDNKDNAAKAAIANFGDIPFVEFSDLDSAEYKSYIGAKVYGNDGEWHIVNNSGVANHPGDKGFEVMAERLLPYVLEKLSI